MQRLRALRHGLLPLMAVALLAMQAAGLKHRIEHGGSSTWAAQSQAVLASALRGVDAAHDEVLEPRHDCVAIDSQTLANAPPAWAAPWCPDADDVRQVALQVAQPFVAGDVRSFLARAPPFPLC